MKRTSSLVRATFRNSARDKQKRTGRRIGAPFQLSTSFYVFALLVHYEHFVIAVTRARHAVVVRIERGGNGRDRLLGVGAGKRVARRSGCEVRCGVREGRRDRRRGRAV